MIIIGLMEIVFGLIKVLLLPIVTILGQFNFNEVFLYCISLLNEFFDLISSGFGFAAYFFHWDVVQVLFEVLVTLSIAFHTFKVIIWIYNKIPFIH